MMYRVKMVACFGGWAVGVGARFVCERLVAGIFIFVIPEGEYHLNI